MSDNLPERVQILGHAHIICITVRENKIICCQIFCDLLLKSAFERIFNVMQLNLVKIKWHIKWKYVIKKFHDICLSYYFTYIKYHEVTLIRLNYHSNAYDLNMWHMHITCTTTQYSCSSWCAMPFSICARENRRTMQKEQSRNVRNNGYNTQTRSPLPRSTFTWFHLSVYLWSLSNESTSVGTVTFIQCIS